jgi:uncharacterized protein YaaQ
VKLIVAIVRDIEADAVLSALVERRFGVTRIASTGGFLRRGNTTFLVGIEDEKVDQALDTLRSACSRSNEAADQRRATLFVLSVARFEQL